MHAQTVNDKQVRENLLSILGKMSKNKEYYSIREVFLREALYYMIFGERSDGKTYSVLEFMLWAYWLFGYEGAIIRRYDEDFVGKRGANMFKNHINNDLISKVTNGEWTTVYYYSGQWFLAKYDDKGKLIHQATPFCYGFSLNAGEHDKSTGYPNVKIILFDEFLTRTRYIPDEFVLFTNVLSTIIRKRGDVVIFMCGNTVNQFCPYFSEMGITKARKMEQGDIDLYTYGTSELVVAVQRTGVKDKKNRRAKASDKYFAFDNPKLNMITNGAWEIAIYPHLPVKYKPSNILFTYFIKYNEFLMQCEIINVDDLYFTYIHRKTTLLQDNKDDIVFTPDYNPSPYYRRKISKPQDEVGHKIYWFYVNDKVFYQDNELGEVVRSYIQWSKTDRGIV